jgi:hypothetical protein
MVTNVDSAGDKGVLAHASISPRNGTERTESSPFVR